MFYTDYKLQYPVRVEKPNPVFARALQQAIGGVEGEIRVVHAVHVPGLGHARPEEVPRHAAQHRRRGDRPHRDALDRGGAQPGEARPVAAGRGVEGSGRRQRAQRHEPAPHPVDRAGRPAGECRRRAVRHVARLRQRQHRRRHVRQRHRRGDRPGAGDAPLQHDRRPGHEGHAGLPDRARHHAPAAVAGGDRGAGRQERAAADPEQLPAGAGEPGVSATSIWASPRTGPSRRAAAGPRARAWTGAASFRYGRWSRRARSRISAWRGRTPARRCSRSGKADRCRRQGP